MNRLLLPIALGLSACHDPDDDTFGEGVAVGNPTKGVTARVLPSADVKNLHGKLEVSAISLIGCDGEADRLVASDLTVPPGGRRVELPLGLYCGLQVDFADLVELDGSFEDGGRFSLTLDVGTVVVETTDPFVTAETELLLVLGPEGWLDEQALGVGPSDLVEIGPGDPAHDGLAAELREQSLLWADEDADRKPDHGERIIARGPAEQAPGRGGKPRK